MRNRNEFISEDQINNTVKYHFNNSIKYQEGLLKVEDFLSQLNNYDPETFENLYEFINPEIDIGG